MDWGTVIITERAQRRALDDCVAVPNPEIRRVLTDNDFQQAEFLAVQFTHQVQFIRTNTWMARQIYVLLSRETNLPPMGIDDGTLEHMSNWFECLRSRQQPHCTVEEGFAHPVACMMAAEAYWSGKRQFWDAARESILDREPASS